jgi:hypothetical protein
MMNKVRLAGVALTHHLVKNLIRRLIDITIAKCLCLPAKLLKIGAREPSGEKPYWI